MSNNELFLNYNVNQGHLINFFGNIILNIQLIEIKNIHINNEII